MRRAASRIGERSAQASATHGARLDRGAHFILLQCARWVADRSWHMITSHIFFVEEWRDAHLRHGWAIGRYVIMPDHVHFFCRPEHDAKMLSDFMGV